LGEKKRGKGCKRPKSRYRGGHLNVPYWGLGGIVNCAKGGRENQVIKGRGPPWKKEKGFALWESLRNTSTGAAIGKRSVRVLKVSESERPPLMFYEVVIEEREFSAKVRQN